MWTRARDFVPDGLDESSDSTSPFEHSLPDAASRPVRRSFLEPKRQGEVGSFRRRGEVGKTRTISNYAQSLGKKYAPTASNIPRRAEMGPCGAPLNV
jgi:hypothetical protein